MIAQFMPLILKALIPKATEHIAKVFKLDKVLRYVEEPNDADKKCQVLELKIIELHLKLDALIEIKKNDEAK